jgi:hypothetical protein
MTFSTLGDSEITNIVAGGVRIIKLTGSMIQYKNINAGFSKVTITDDTGNNEVDGDTPNAAQVK